MDRFKVYKLKRLWILLLAPLSFLLTSLAHSFPAAVEKYFSRGLYVFFKESYGRVFGLLPFSAIQFLIILLPLLALYYVFISVFRTVKNRDGTGKQRIYRVFVNLCCAVCILWFSFTMFCGLNYAREGFAVSAGLEVRPSSAEELAALCEELLERVNDNAGRVARDDKGRMFISAKSKYALAREIRSAYKKTAAIYPILGGFTPLPKPVLYSRLMSYTDIIGIYAPFTMEANINTDITDYNIPSAMAHELAHFKGFMREDEANFIAYLACATGGGSDLAYSGSLLALSHVSGKLYMADSSAYWRIMDGLSESVLTDYRANSEYWKQFDGPVADFSNSMNDAYLKTNRQADGVQSYGRMVDLLLADYRKRKGPR